MGVYIPAPIGDSSPGVAPGGLQGQFLRKASDLDYDTDWEDVVATPDPAGHPHEVRIDTTTTSNTIYAGTAVNGSTEAAAVWKITRSTYNPAGQRTSKGVATDVTWTGRAGHTYS